MTVNGSKDLTGDIYIARREFLGNVYATGSGLGSTTLNVPIQSQFQIQTYNINAALNTTFPWLSQVAKNFTFYKFHGLVFEYKPTSGEFGNLQTNALGKVVMCTQYDPDAPPFPSSQQMENYDYATACKPAEHMLHGVETKAVQRGPDMLYTRTGASAKDEVLTDLGDFQIATEGIPVNIPAQTNGAVVRSVTVAVGELWVAYKVQLSRANIYALSATAPADEHIGLTLGAGAPSGLTTAIGSGPSATGTFAGLNPLQQRLFNAGTSTANFCPKVTNTLGTQVWGSAVAVSGTVFYVVFPPGTSGNYNIQVTLTSDENQTIGLPLPNAGVVADLIDLINSGYTVPNGLIGTLSVAVNNTVAVVQPSPSAAASFAATTTNGTYSGFNNPMATTKGTTCQAIVSFNTPPNQIPIWTFSLSAQQAASHGLAITVQIYPTILNGQS